MKTLIRSLIATFILCCLQPVFGLNDQDRTVINKETTMPDLTYSWNAVSGAVSYTVVIKHQSSHVTGSQETFDSTATFENLPSGTYHITVTAKDSNGSTSIVIEDISEL